MALGLHFSLTNRSRRSIFSSLFLSHGISFSLSCLLICCDQVNKQIKRINSYKRKKQCHQQVSATQKNQIDSSEMIIPSTNLPRIGKDRVEADVFDLSQNWHRKNPTQSFNVRFPPPPPNPILKKKGVLSTNHQQTAVTSTENFFFHFHRNMFRCYSNRAKRRLIGSKKLGNEDNRFTFIVGIVIGTLLKEFVNGFHNR